MVLEPAAQYLLLQVAGQFGSMPSCEKRPAGSPHGDQEAFVRSQAHRHVNVMPATMINRGTHGQRFITAVHMRLAGGRAGERGGRGNLVYEPVQLHVVVLQIFCHVIHLRWCQSKSQLVWRQYQREVLSLQSLPACSPQGLQKWHRISELE